MSSSPIAVICRRSSLYLPLKTLGGRLGRLSLQNNVASALAASSPLWHLPTTLVQRCTNTTTLPSMLLTSTKASTRSPLLSTTSLALDNRPHPSNSIQIRTLALDPKPTGRKSLLKRKKKKKRHVSALQKARLRRSRNMTEERVAESKAADEASVAVQHREWVDFQKSIAVDGFETGQSMEVVAGHTRNRQMRAQRRARKLLAERILARKEELKTIQKTGEITPLSYSPEETERLLKMADEALPKRDGKRGTRNLKRQARRWFLVRKIHKKYKKNIIRAHFRRMQKRSDRKKWIMHVINKAPTVRKLDREYQLESFKRWATQLQLDVGQHDDSDEWEDVEEEGGAKQNM